MRLHTLRTQRARIRRSRARRVELPEQTDPHGRAERARRRDRHRRAPDRAGAAGSAGARRVVDRQPGRRGRHTRRRDGREEFGAGRLHHAARQQRPPVVRAGDPPEPAVRSAEGHHDDLDGREPGVRRRGRRVGARELDAGARRARESEAEHAAATARAAPAPRAISAPSSCSSRTGMKMLHIPYKGTGPGHDRAARRGDPGAASSGSRRCCRT